MKSKSYHFIDLFAGAGGLAEGFINENFVPLAHIEMNDAACETLKTRISYHYLKNKNKLELYNDYLLGNISRETFLQNIPNSVLNSVIHEQISDKTIPGMFSFIEKEMNRNKADVDVIVGGPPCQAYSLVGRAVQGARVANDPRNFLYKMYLKFVDHFRPKILVFENVLGILSANKGQYYDDLKTLMKQSGYEIDARILNANDYGVLQNRKRVIIIGIRNDLEPADLYPLPNEIGKLYKVKNVLEDLPSLKNIETCNVYKKKPNDYLILTGIRTEHDILTWHVKRNNNERDKRIYYLTINAWNKKGERLKYTDLPSELQTHKNKTAFLDRFKVVAEDSNFSQTILAHLSKDGHYFIHPDINQTRSISVREAARLQSFPDSYYFEGNRGNAFTQIGNAVPPLMSREIAKKIRKYLEDRK